MLEKNKYAQLLKAQGEYVIEIDSIDWYGYQGFMLPAYFPHCTPKISKNNAKKALSASGRPFVRWDSNFSRLEKSEWWYILKRGHWNIDDIENKKKRWMIRQGKKNFEIRLLSYDEVIEFCPEVALASAARYKGATNVEDRDILKTRVDAGKQVPGVLEFVGCFYGDKLVSYSENYIQNNAVWPSVIRHHPEYLNKYSSYGLMNGILEYYLNEKNFDYVLDGSRSIHHKTQFQEHLIKVFGFTKEYADLNVRYSNLFGTVVKIAYPFRNAFAKLSEKTESGFIANVSAVLKQEHIKKACQQTNPR
jgi:hypothetical protein